MERWGLIRAAVVAEVMQADDFVRCSRLVNYGIAPNAMFVETPWDRQASGAVHVLVLKSHSAWLYTMPGCPASRALPERWVLSRGGDDRGLKYSANDEIDSWSHAD